MHFVPAKEFIDTYHISYATLKNWKDRNKVKTKILSERKVLYDLDFLDKTNSVEEKKNVLYARVSTTNQKSQLDTQVEVIKNYALSTGVKIDAVYADIASGMNTDRQQFNSMLSEITRGKINTVYVTYKDRLTRFGFGYLSNMFSLLGTKIIVLNDTDTAESSFKDELANDLISMIHHYSLKVYSNKRKQLKEIESIIKENK